MYHRTILLSIVSVLAASCTMQQAENNKPVRQETPKALQENKIDIKSYGRSGNLIEELYAELAGNSLELKRLDEDMEALRPKENELAENFEAYDNKSSSYYASANNKALTITDSLLRKKMSALIEASNNRYSKDTEELNLLLKQIAKNSTTINDHYSILKIVLTLPIIEKYQGENKPGKQDFTNLINEQQQLIKRTDSLTPAY
ncbi:MAG: hypothetical protein HYZ44_11700 [Bacteroidetes bacterium]|nr:hypothetical protein [Bacteroidota bacterium]